MDNQSNSNEVEEKKPIEEPVTDDPNPPDRPPKGDDPNPPDRPPK